MAPDDTENEPPGTQPKTGVNNPADQQINQKSSKKQSKKNLRFIGLYTAFFLVAFPAIAVYAYYYGQYDCLVRQFIYYACSGGLGGAIYSSFGLNTHLFKEDFDGEKFIWWYIFRPIASGIMGIFAIFFFAGGFMAVSGMTASALTDICAHPNSIMFYCAFAFLAGYACNKFIKKIDVIAEVIFVKSSVDEENNKSQKPGPELTPAPQPEKNR
jgi:hypothetical protein